MTEHSTNTLQSYMLLTIGASSSSGTTRTCVTRLTNVSSLSLLSWSPWSTLSSSCSLNAFIPRQSDLANRTLASRRSGITGLSSRTRITILARLSKWSWLSFETCCAAIPGCSGETRGTCYNTSIKLDAAAQLWSMHIFKKLNITAIFQISLWATCRAAAYVCFSTVLFSRQWFSAVP